MDHMNGLLLPLQKQPLLKAACRARVAFEQERGVKPGKYCINPVHRDLLPPDMQLDGLPVLLDSTVRANHLLICAGESKTPDVLETRELHKSEGGRLGA